MKYDSPAIFRLTACQKASLGQIASATGRTCSAWIREAIEREARLMLSNNGGTADDRSHNH